MKKEYLKSKVEVWGGLECTINRVQDNYLDQLAFSGHYKRAAEDITRFAQLGIKAIRYPVLWEHHKPKQDAEIDWSYSAAQLGQLRTAGIQPIVGLVHHGSGPAHVNFYDGSFEEGVAEYAGLVATQFPWVEYYTPINEPVTTARFCGLYGLWYPHKRTDKDFLRILISECKATVFAMQAIRKINPAAKLVQTEDLGKTHSTPKLEYQAKFENRRRWLSFDLLCGRVKRNHSLRLYMLKHGVSEADLQFFIDNACPPDILGINHYITSERWLDETLSIYPKHTHGGNRKHRYADVEAVRAGKNIGPKPLLKECWNRYHLPIAITEVHLHCTREEQLRWFTYVWNAATELADGDVDIKAVTAWAALGSYDWSSLLTVPAGLYEPGLFDVRGPEPRATAMSKLVRQLASGSRYEHPVLEEKGWWQRDCAIEYDIEQKAQCYSNVKNSTAKPIVIIGKTGTLGKAFHRLCELRGLPHVMLGREDINITDVADIEKVIGTINPWAVVNTAGYVRVDDAENDRDACYMVNSTAPKYLAEVCRKYGVQFVTYSSDLVFDGMKMNPYLESDLVSPLNVYGQSKVLAEENVLKSNSTALIIRTSAFFGPWDQYNFVHHALKAAKDGEEFKAPGDVLISPTYVPDLVNTSLDLLIDEANGIWNISNKGSISWAMLAEEVAKRSGFNPKNFKTVTLAEMNFTAPRPSYSVLTTEKGFELPALDTSLDRFLKEQEIIIL